MTAPGSAAQRTLPSEPLPRPERIGKYPITGWLGRGGMGAVYAAQDPILHRTVAIKLLTRPMAEPLDAEERFLREARALASLNHPNIVTVHGADRHEDGWFLVMELVPGGSLQEQLAVHGPFRWPEATRLLAEACRALAAAHVAGILHRDVKPANMLLSAAGTVKVADFGLAKLLDPAVPSLTGHGSVLGTPEYMSPEQCQGSPATEQSDLYGLGASYYALLTAEPPFRCKSAVETLLAHCMQPVPDPCRLRPDIDARCAEIVARALAKKPAGRYDTCQALLTDLEALLDSPATVRLSRAPVAPPAGASRAGAPTEVLSGTCFRSRTRALAACVAVVLATAAIVWQAGPFRTGPQPAQVKGAQPAPDSRPEPAVALPIEATAYCLAFSPDGRKLAAGISNDPGGLVVWEVATRKSERRWPGLQFRAVAFSADGLLLAAGTSADGSVRLVDFTTGKTQTKALDPWGATINALAFVAGTHTLVAASHGYDPHPSRLCTWDVPTDQLVLGKEVHPAQPLALGLCGDGRWIVSSYTNGALDVRKRADGTLVTTVQVAPKPVAAFPLAVAPDGETVALGVGTRVQLRNLKGLQQPAQEWDAGHDVWSLAFAEDPTLLVSAGASKVRVWDTAKQQVLQDVPVQDTVYRVALAPGGKLLATSRGDRTVYLQDAGPWLSREKR